jgi:hypothetical protein
MTDSTDALLERVHSTMPDRQSAQWWENVNDGDCQPDLVSQPGAKNMLASWKLGGILISSAAAHN